MGASMSAVTSCRASRSDLRGGLRGFAVDKFGCALCVGCGGEHCSIVSRQHFQPVCDIGRMIFAGLKSKLQIGAQERGPKFGNQLLDRVTFAPKAMPAEVTVEPGLAACPVGAFVGKRRVVPRLPEPAYNPANRADDARETSGAEIRSCAVHLRR